MSLDELRKSDEPTTQAEPTPEPQKPTEPKKETKPKEKTEKKSTTQLVKDEVAKLFSEGWIVGEKSDKVKLNKQIRQNLKLKSGWSTDINNIIQEYMEKNNLQIPDKVFKDSKIGGMTVVLSSPENENTSTQANVKPNTTQTPLGNMPQSATSKGALPKATGSSDAQTRQEESAEPEKKYMSESAQKKLISHGLTKVIFPLYTAMGIVELDDEEIKEESKVPKGKKVKQDFEELAGEIDEYLRENDIKLPALLNHLSIGISVFVVLILPVIKFKFFSSKEDAKPDYDESANNIKVD